MVELSGNFESVKTENLFEFFHAIVKNEESAKKLTNDSSRVHITKNGDQFNIETVYPQKTLSISFKIGDEFEDTVSKDFVLKSTAALDGNKIVIHSKREGKDIGKREYEFTDDGLVLSIFAVVTPIVATRTFKRI